MRPLRTNLSPAHTHHVMTATEVLKQLKALGNETTRKTLVRHGAYPNACYGVKIGDLKPLQKKIKVDHQLALDLFDSGIYDAIYLAGLIADDAKMTKKDLRKWAKSPSRRLFSGSTIPWVAAGSPHAADLAAEWIESKDDAVAAIGWNTLTSIMSVAPDEELDLPGHKKLLKRIEKEIHKAGNVTKYAMNNFVISCGCFVAPLNDAAKKSADKIGEVEVDHGDTACRTPYAPAYIAKVEKMGRVGKKKKTIKC